MNHSEPALNLSQLPEHILTFFKPETYVHPTSAITMIQTHASWVFLTGDFAYKFKKPVDFGFMDFSTLAKRKFYCEQELKLNRRTSADIYLEVCAVVEREGRFYLSGSGEVIDYCLKMVQFDQGGLFDHKLAQGRFQPEWMDELARDVAGFHQQAEINGRPSFDHSHYLAEHIQANLQIAAKFSAEVVSEEDLQTLKTFGATQLKQQERLLSRRQQDKHIRHCHGDLHFRNITLINKKPVVFDCIEFNDEFRIIDTMNDVAFLLMDCDAHGRADLGFRFLSRYLDLCGDYEGLALLPLYLFYRAGVRGKVACILADTLLIAQQQPQWQEATHYFSLALGYTKKTEPKLFVIGGLSGSGKSHLALQGCGAERAVIIRSDAVRKRISSQYPQLGLYGKEMSIHTYQAMFDAASLCLGAGFSVILDATFLHPDSRRQLFAFAREMACPLRFYWLTANEKLLRKRVVQRTKHDNDISDADLQVLNQQLAQYQQPAEEGIIFLPGSDGWPDDAKQLNEISL